MPVSYDSIIFDLDGTLWDTTENAAKVWNLVFSNHGLSKRLSAKDVANTCGLSHLEIAKHVFPDWNQKESTAIMDECLAKELNGLQNGGGVLYPSVKSNLILLAQKYPLFIVSNCQSGYIEMFLQNHQLEDVFKDYECHGRTKLSKAENIERIISDRQLRQPVYIGDTEGDETAARKVGIQFFHVRYGFGRAQSPDLSFATFNELSDFFLS
jgi:phosphoglycolate phosphatase